MAIAVSAMTATRTVASIIVMVLEVAVVVSRDGQPTPGRRQALLGLVVVLREPVDVTQFFPRVCVHVLLQVLTKLAEVFGLLIPIEGWVEGVRGRNCTGVDGDYKPQTKRARGGTAHPTRMMRPQDGDKIQITERSLQEKHSYKLSSGLDWIGLGIEISLGK